MKRFANADWTDGSYLKAMQGLQPRHYVVPEGTYLYRFIDLGKGPASKGADGEWWFEYEHYNAITSFAARNGYSVGYVARLFAAILYEWSNVNAVVRARVIQGPLMVWKGPGKQVTARKSDPRDIAVRHGVITDRRDAFDVAGPPPTRRMTPTQGPLQVLQLYIPGLGHPHHKFADLMSIQGFEQIQSHLP
jgi:hypothetical protein